MKKLLIATGIAVFSLSIANVSARDTTYWKQLKLINKQIRKNTYYKTHGYMYNIEQFKKKTEECRINTKDALNEVVAINENNPYYVSQIMSINSKDVAVIRSHEAKGDKFLLLSGNTGQMFATDQTLVSMLPKFMVFKGYQTAIMKGGAQEELQVFELLSLEKAPRLPEPKSDR